MKKHLLTAVLCFFAFGVGVGVNNIAVSQIASSKVAYVNVGKLLASSNSLKAAEKAREMQTKEMLKWYDTANADIRKQTSESARKTLIDKYEDQLTQKKATIRENYAKKINTIDTQLNSIIAQKSKALGYDLVFRRDAMLFGGTDITAEILPLVK